MEEIEVGEYVNGNPVLKIDGNVVTTGFITDFSFILDKNIKSILTKEQFKNAEYRV